MDDLDRKIVSLLQKNARIPLKTLGEQVYLSSPAVATRIERLEREGIIEGYEVKVNKQRLGYKITAFVNLEIDPAQKTVFFSFVQSCPNVLECNCLSDNSTVLMKVAFKNTGELDTFSHRLQEFGKADIKLAVSTPVKAREIDFSMIEEDEEDEI